ncbi:uncharacterized protein K02A2.6-like [Rosa chinensis]|uniref:uncharacterized protein K02A2.6-like n=1 Tax=Rosa chinensis TaxID=74649 RepID=UPI001AD920A6|nr:uncharacterized protein K02A2.6-like [Rosa chinensis]
MLPVATNPLTDRYEDPRNDTDSDEERPGAMEDIEEVVLLEQFPDRIVKPRTTLALFLPVRQKRRAFTHDKYRAIQVEVKKLMAINFVREVTYPRWLANVVMIPKKSPGSWRMCVDYTNVNRACPKDSFPLPRIDQLIDSTAGYRLLSFMDAFSGYNQIRMNPADEEYTAFTTEKGLYCYQLMPFGLKNAGATYQRLVNSMFEEVIGTIIEVYVDEMLVKSLTSEDHVSNLSIVFAIILRNGMRLNPQKCIFGVEVGKFLGYIISHKGIEANLEKVQAILDMVSPTYRNEVQSLTGEMLYIYLVASSMAVSSALIRKDSDCEYPVYYARKGYTGAESRYPDCDAPEILYEYALKFAFKASNNAAEYEALIAGLQIARELGVQHLSIFSDSQLVVNQVSGNFEAKEPHMSSYQALAQALVQRFTSIFTQILSAENDKASALAKIAAISSSPTYGATKVEILERPNTSKTVSEIFMVDHTASWMDPILKYMVDGLAPDDKVEVRRLQLRFGVPDTIVTDNGTQFDNDELSAYIENLGTRILYASPAHPQTNGQVEAVNKIIKKILKKKLDEAKGLWAAKLPEIPRIEYFNEGTNSEGLQLDADLLEERRDVAHMHNLANKWRIARYYDAKVQSRTLKLGDWVMKQAYLEPRGLDPSWTGPYEIIEEVGPATFYIRDTDGVVSRHPRNTQHLRYYYK